MCEGYKKAMQGQPLEDCVWLLRLMIASLQHLPSLGIPHLGDIELLSGVLVTWLKSQPCLKSPPPSVPRVQKVQKGVQNEFEKVKTLCLCGL
jgi:hypothetical protein